MWSAGRRHGDADDDVRNDEVDVFHRPPHRLSRLDRLEEGLNRESDLDQKVKAALPHLWLPLVRDLPAPVGGQAGETPIILDLSDIAKAPARKMDYLATVRDGTTGRLVNGYWLVEPYASVSRKNPMPILLEPFSHEQPHCRGQNPIVVEAVRRLFELTGRRGVLVVDREAMGLFS